MSVLYPTISFDDGELRVIMNSTKTDNENQYRLGGDLMVNRLGFGTMQLTGPGVWGEPTDPAAAKRLLATAVEQGVNFFDTADSYGPATVEELIRGSIGSRYNDVIIATKGGLERGGPGQWYTNGHPAYIARTIDESLQRLGKEQLQLWQLHRVDPRIPIEDSLAPVAKAIGEGKVLKVGLSEVNIATIER
ncbi:MAG TPA: aldo/keto reductase, partial [Puia sp.]|nr:aldo/keto reductase [Puia sp.]